MRKIFQKNAFIRKIHVSIKKKHFWFWALKVFRILAFCIGLFFFARTFAYHSAVIILNSPQDYREDTLVLFTAKILDNKPIFTASTMPAYTNGYGMLYSYVVAVAAKFVGSSYVTHRFISALFLFACLIWLYKIARKIDGDWLTSFLGVLVLYYYMAFSPVESGPRGDSLGLFLFFVTVFIPWYWDFSYLSLFVGVFASILAFYTKPYFVLGVIYVGTYLLLSRQIKKVFLFIGSWIILFVLIALWVNGKYDFYFFNTITIFNKVLNYLWWYFKLQTKDYILNNLALFITSMVAVSVTLRVFIQRKKYLAYFPPAYFILCLIVSWGLITARLGGNAGNYITYYDQLISPFMLLVAVAFWRNGRSIVLTGLLFISICVLLVKTNFTVDAQAINQNRNEWEQYLNKYTSIFASPAFSYYVYTRGMPVYDAGQAEYFPQGIPQDGSPVSKIAAARYASEIRELEKKIANKEFDLLMYWVPYTNGVGNLMYNGYLRDYVRSHYHYVGIKKWITVYRVYDMEVWER